MESPASQKAVRPGEGDEGQVRATDYLQSPEVLHGTRAGLLSPEVLNSLCMLGEVAKLKDDNTGAHIERMGICAAGVARVLGLSDLQCELMRYTAPLHDIGKVGVPDYIINKPGALDAAQLGMMRQHPWLGYRLLKLSQSLALRLAGEISLSHHERWDGGGYPLGSAGEAIPLSGRIVAVADVFDALTSERPYKRAWSREEALQFVIENAGAHFDPRVAAALGEYVCGRDEVTVGSAAQHSAAGRAPNRAR